MNAKYFETTEGLAKLLVDYQEMFTLVDEYGQQFIAGVLSTSDDYREALNKLTGAYMCLEPLFSTSEAYKLNQELQFYVEKKRELEAKGEKVVAASLEKEASYSVEGYRRVRNILEGYVLASEKGIITCQTQLRRMEEARNKPVEEQ